MNIFIIAGEVSGDNFAAELMSNMQKKSNVVFYGYGGQKMREQGLISPIKDNSLLSTVGYTESLKYLTQHLGALMNVVKYIKEYKCKYVIMVDHELFNIYAARAIRREFGNSVKIYYYIPPRVSMWGSAKNTAKLFDALFCYMEPDLPLYLEHNSNSFYFGSPLAKKLKNHSSSPDFFIRNGLDPHKSYAAILPGSRKHEIRSLLPVFLKAAARLNIERNIYFLIPSAHKDLKPLISKAVKKARLEHCVYLVDDSGMEVMSHCSFGMLSAGTATLEAAMAGMYPIIAYKVSHITLNAIKRANGLNHLTMVGLPNVLLKKRVFPELLLSGEVTPERVYQESIYFLDMDREVREYLMHNVKTELSMALGDPDSVDSVADYIIKANA